MAEPRESEAVSLSDTQFGHLTKDLKDPEEGGFTVSTQTGDRPSGGFSVSIPGHEEVRDLATTRPGHLANYVGHHREALDRPKTRHFGGWADDNKAYLDVSNVHPDTPGGEFAARFDTVHGNQRAYYDITGGTSYYNPFHPHAMEGTDMTMPVHDDPKLQRDWVMAPLRYGSKRRPPKVSPPGAST